MGGRQQIIDVFLTESSGSHERERLGVICPNTLANGARFTGNSGDGRYQAYGMQYLKQSIPKQRADTVFKWLIAQSSEPISTQRAQKGGSKPRSWPFARWLLDQDPFENKRSWATNCHHAVGWRGIGYEGLYACDGRAWPRAQNRHC